jgi:hypothetical protein
MPPRVEGPLILEFQTPIATLKMLGTLLGMVIDVQSIDTVRNSFGNLTAGSKDREIFEDFLVEDLKDQGMDPEAMLSRIQRQSAPGIYSEDDLTAIVRFASLVTKKQNIDPVNDLKLSAQLQERLKLNLNRMELVISSDNMRQIIKMVESVFRGEFWFIDEKVAPEKRAGTNVQAAVIQDILTHITPEVQPNLDDQQLALVNMAEALLAKFARNKDLQYYWEDLSDAQKAIVSLLMMAHVIKGDKEDKIYYPKYTDEAMDMIIGDQGNLFYQGKIDLWEALDIPETFRKEEIEDGDENWEDDEI